ncbi:MAG: hypothetical protein ABMA64_15150 [Myxococcota bacterium]
MRDVDQWLAALDGPPPPPRAPDWPAERSSRWRPWAIAGGLALAAGVALALALPERGPRSRGVPSELPELDLRMVAERGGVAVRVSEPLHTGERVLFRASADRQTRAELWVEGPRGRERLTGLTVDPTPRDVGDATGLLGYRFDTPGRYVFHLTPEGDTCGECPALPVEVR